MDKPHLIKRKPKENPTKKETGTIEETAAGINTLMDRIENRLRIYSEYAADNPMDQEYRENGEPIQTQIPETPLFLQGINDRLWDGAVQKWLRKRSRA